ncbi:hypothetical protein [Accumulibacter sp.]|uniref:hypothetical protein n=1 Tax=Accumulibacter sp. TaxID=2053492 RepID=UPI0025E35693|nr:hypothetical protein [Accumulibacter sp.]MCM8610719.1 hypothetical protein [Accumulibacter sp.]MCM8634607.1 hypothetical protein [Accumulibacter sp.]MCM8638107.1 hypothetical protein [Accumulibacter sp.]
MNLSLPLRVAGACLSGVLLGACGTVDWSGQPEPVGDPRDRALTQAPNPTVSLPPVKAAALAGSVGYMVNQYGGPAQYLNYGAAAVVAAYVIYDPLAPNWTIEETLLEGDTYRLAMRAKSFRIGGDGESGLIFKRRALQLQRQRGFAAYRVLDYSEGIESSTPFTHRYAEGVFQLVAADPARKP